MNFNQEMKWLLEEKYDGVESGAFHTDLKRLEDGEPLGYVIGHVPFLDCQIFLDLPAQAGSRPLIPRLETEFWVEEAIGEIKQTLISGVRPLKYQPEGEAKPCPLAILDLCSGSGCIGVAVAKAFPNAEVTFAEIDAVHLPTIQKNISFNKIENSKIIQSDLFENISGKFDFILTNPPYIDPILNRVEASVKEYEPHLALYGGQDGMEIINAIIYDSVDYLVPSGQLWIEHEPEQVKLIVKLGKDAGFASVLPQLDQYNTTRYSILVY